MGIWGKLRRATDYLRKLRLSLGPDSYFQYKRQRNYERKEADHARRHARVVAEGEREHGREKAAREREYEERYARGREGDVAADRTQEAEPEP
jgi:hypothetical protein